MKHRLVRGERWLIRWMALVGLGWGLGAFAQSSGEYSLERRGLGQPGVITALSEPNPGEPLDIALDFIRGNRQALALSEDDLNGILVSGQHPSAKTGVTHLYLRQRYRGIEVFGADLNIHIAADGRVLSLHSRFAGQLQSLVNSETPGISVTQAVAAAAAHLNLSATRPITVLTPAEGPDRAQMLSDGGISRDPMPAKLMYLPVAENQIRLVWTVEIREPGHPHHWHVRVDAHNGAFLSKDDYFVEDPLPASLVQKNDGEDSESLDAQPFSRSDKRAPDQYEVFAMPSEYPYDGPRVVEVDPADALASPFGWHDTDGVAGPEFTITRGNNVHAFLDRDNNDLPDPGADVDGGPALDFTGPLVPLDLGLDPSAYTAAAVTNLFYWNNILHDVFYRYGFDEASGNFQVNNYGNGGAGGDDVIAYAQKGADTGIFNNAFFGTPSDGNRPEMLMHLFNSTVPNRDADLANGIIAHEFGHGISNRLTGGPGNVFCLFNGEQMGEGWSDFVGLVLTAKASDAPDTVRGLGVYVLGQAVDGPGIRPAPYTTDLAVNGFTYGDIPGMGSHSRGFVWCSMLWEMYWGLVLEHGFNPDFYGDHTTGGNNLAIQLVIEGMKLQPCSPGFVDGRDAILLADMNLTGGANQCIIWDAFAKRGLGLSADQGSSSSGSDGVEAFDVPDCVVVCDNLLEQLPLWGDTLTILDLLPCIDPPQ